MSDRLRRTRTTSLPQRLQQFSRETLTVPGDVKMAVKRNAFAGHGDFLHRFAQSPKLTRELEKLHLTLTNKDVMKIGTLDDADTVVNNDVVMADDELFQGLSAMGFTGLIRVLSSFATTDQTLHEESLRRDVGFVKQRLRVHHRFLLKPHGWRMQYWDLVTIMGLAFVVYVTPFEGEP